MAFDAVDLIKVNMYSLFVFFLYLQFEQIFEMSLKTDDELFHVALYDSLIENNQSDTLLYVSFSSILINSFSKYN